ncbi:MAG: gfo/Idh/MocA family oxidoreductase [Thermoprotei archaeon]|nr:MAG: gfo/Idh/MocA family oxidoreductase [Thermoprotei archaeon]
MNLCGRRVKRLRIGFIGCGGIASEHARRLASIREAELVAFSDVRLERAKALSAKYGGRAYADWREMLNKEPLDVVFICLPPFAHGDEVIIAAERGVHIYIEKPIALDMKLAEEMVRAVEKSGVKSQVGYQLRFAAGVERAKKLVEEGVVGDIGLVVGMYWCRFIRRDWWLDRRKSGGQLVEQATHLYDILRWLCGDVKRVYAEMDRIFYRDLKEMTIEDVSGVVLRFKSGAIGLVSSTIGAVPGFWWFRWSIIGRDAMLECEEPNSLRVYYSSHKPLRIEEFREVGRDPMLLAELDLINAIIEDRETRVPISEGAKTLQLTLAAVRAAETGKPVTLN